MRFTRVRRGALSNPAGRHARRDYVRTNDECDEPLERLPTELHVDAARTVIARDRSPDIPFEQSVNPGRRLQMHGEQLNDARYGSRPRGTGPFAALLEARFDKVRRTYGLDDDAAFELDPRSFRSPKDCESGQLESLERLPVL